MPDAPPDAIATPLERGDNLLKKNRNGRAAEAYAAALAAADGAGIGEPWRGLITRKLDLARRLADDEDPDLDEVAPT